MRGTSGFTFVEVLISLAITGAVMAMTIPFLHVQKRLYERQEARREARRTVDGALAWLTRDLAQAGYHAPGPPLRRLEPGAIAYVLSRDEDDPAAFTPANRRLVTLYLDGGDLKYRVQAPLPAPAAGWESGSTQVLAPGIAALRCRGYQADGLETADPAEATLVGCTVEAAGAAATALVRLRNAGQGGS